MTLKLSPEWKRYASMDNDEVLLEELIQTPSTLISFFQAACDDESWAQHHPLFFKKALGWFTHQFFERKLSLESARVIANCVRQYHSFLGPFLPANIILKTGGDTITINGLLLAVSSDYFRDLMRFSQPTGIEVQGLKRTFLPIIQEFVHLGTVETLWKLDKEELYELLKFSNTTKLNELGKLCEETLRRYISNENALEILLESHQKGWTILRNTAEHKINLQGLGIKFFEAEIQPHMQGRVLVNPLGFEFNDFSDTSLEIFDKVKLYITHLVCSGHLAEEGIFTTVVQSCPNLISFALSRSFSFSERLADLPTNLQRLDLSACSWVNDYNLKKMISICPTLHELILSSNPEITYLGWGELQRLNALESLDISRCTQIRDEDFSVIVRSCPGLIELSIEECSNLTDRAYSEISRNLSRVVVLNVARTEISDGMLVDVLSRCRSLRQINISRCEKISEKGITRALNQIHGLKRLDLRHCQLSGSFVQNLRKTHSQVAILY